MHALLAPVVLKEKTGFAFQTVAQSQTFAPRDLFGGEMMTQLLQRLLLCCQVDLFQRNDRVINSVEFPQDFERGQGGQVVPQMENAANPKLPVLAFQWSRAWVRLNKLEIKSGI